MIEQRVWASFQRYFVGPVALALTHRIKPNTVTWFAGVFGLFIFPALVFFHSKWLAIFY